MNASEFSQRFTARHVAVPVIIGMGLSAYLIVTGFNPLALSRITLNAQLLTGFACAAVMVLLRDAAYVWRIKLLTGGRLSWWRSVEVVLLWEFGSAITPGAVGGIALALFILKKEGISYGRSVATIMLTTLFDNVAFVGMFALMYALTGHAMFDVPAQCPDVAQHAVLQGLSKLADKSVIGFAAYALSAVLLAVALFVMPHRTQALLERAGSIRLLKRWQAWLHELGSEIAVTASETKQMPLRFFAFALALTLVAWISRYLLANTLLWGFAAQPLVQLEVLARQYVLWVFIMLPSTPGASGLAELSFMAFNCQYIPTGLSAAVAVIWRMYSYYLYLVVGVVVFPRWLARVRRLGGVAG